MTITEASPAPPPQPSQESLSSKRRWKPSKITIAVVIMILVGATAFMYPATAAWLSAKNQSARIEQFTESLQRVEPSVAEQLDLAHEYNSKLIAGVKLEANANIAVGDGTSSDDSLEYDKILRADSSGQMGRVKIPKIDVDLPIYHGTDDDTLLEGAGHLEGSHLPVSGTSTHSVITAHRGLASATMFDNLDKVEVGDRFTLVVFGEVLSYEVRETKVVEPTDTESLRPTDGLDLVTLITCTPLGINSHRILVTGERVTPTPAKDVEDGNARPEIPGFPWWAVGLAGIYTAAGAYLWRRGYTDAAIAHKLAVRKSEGETTS